MGPPIIYPCFTTLNTFKNQRQPHFSGILVPAFFKTLPGLAAGNNSNS